MTNGLSDHSDATAIRPGVRPLTDADLERCIAIDRALSGRLRRGFFEKWLDAAMKDPERFVYVGVTDGNKLAGYALVRLLVGEYAAAAPFGVLDAIRCRQRAAGQGIWARTDARHRECHARQGGRRTRPEHDEIGLFLVDGI